MVAQGETLDAIEEKKEEMLESIYNFLSYLIRNTSKRNSILSTAMKKRTIILTED
jgi:aminopeptidase C